MTYIYIPELVGVGLRQTSVSPELHIVISGSSVVFLKGRVEALSSVVRATVVSPHQPLCMTGWSQWGAGHLWAGWRRKCQAAVPTRSLEQVECVWSGLVFKHTSGFPLHREQN